MSSSDPFPTRVLVIAGTIVVLLGMLLWFLSGLGTPTQPVPGLDDEGDVAADPALPSPPDIEPDDEETEARPVTGPPLAPGVAPDVATEAITLELFVVEPGTDRLRPQVRRLQAPMTLPAQAQIALEELVRSTSGLSPLPPETVVREVWVSPGGIAYVDFGADFPSLLPQGSLGELHAVYGVVATLTSSFPNIRAVQFLVGGSPVDTLTGHVDTARPVPPWAGWIY